MSNYCSWYAQHCLSNCCDKYGQCPEYSGLSCYYPYQKASLTHMMMGLGPHSYLIVLGCIALVCIAIFACWCCSQGDSDENYLPSFGRGANLVQQTTTTRTTFQQPAGYPVVGANQTIMNANSFQSPGWVRAAPSANNPTLGVPQAEPYQQMLQGTSTQMDDPPQQAGLQNNSQPIVRSGTFNGESFGAAAFSKIQQQILTGTSGGIGMPPQLSS